MEAPVSGGLHVARGVTLPTDFVTKTTGILAQRRKGKTYTASVFVGWETRVSPWPTSCG